MRAGICTTIETKVKLRCDVDWMKKASVAGVVIWPNILFAQKASKVPQWLFRHELEHAYQIIRNGPLRFYFKYFYYQLRYGYQKNPFEVEARQRQHDPLTKDEEQLLWKLRENSTNLQVALVPK